MILNWMIKMTSEIAWRDQRFVLINAIHLALPYFKEEPRIRFPLRTQPYVKLALENDIIWWYHWFPLSRGAGQILPVRTPVFFIITHIIIILYQKKLECIHFCSNKAIHGRNIYRMRLFFFDMFIIVSLQPKLVHYLFSKSTCIFRSKK